MDDTRGQIAFYSARNGNPDIYIMDADGGNVARLTSNPADDMAPAISPDGTRIAFMSVRDGNREIYLMDLDGSKQQRLTDNPAYESHPDWSPDGTQIAFVSDRDGNLEIYVMDADGSDLRRLTDSPSEEMRPSWSPDGTRIAFSSRMQNEDWDIYVMDADGSNSQRLIESEAVEFAPAWSPDGSQIAYMSSERRGAVEIRLIDADGSNDHPLPGMGDINEDPAWSPGGTKIVFQSNRDGHWEVYVMDADGSNQRRLTNHPAGAYWPSWGPSPVGAPDPVPTAAPAEQPLASPVLLDPPAMASLNDTWFRPADEAAMVYVPGGTFQMGSDAGDTHANDDEFPKHSVTLDGFWIDRTEVTNAQYALCVASDDCEPMLYAVDATLSGEDYPVAGVSWEDAADYCAWAGARLPTEAEWEYAARGTQGSIYPWGDGFDCARGNFREGCDGYSSTAPVGSFPSGASWCGALDMAGNVWEWVADWAGDYPSEAQTNPAGPPTGVRRIFRGGSFRFGESYVRTADRSRHNPSERGGNGGYIGLRCALSAP
jgi:TolB protein